MLLNVGSLTLCVVFAVFYPHIGTIIRYNSHLFSYNFNNECIYRSYAISISNFDIHCLLLLNRFAGAFCGLAYIFTFPPIIYLIYCKKIGTLTVPKIVIHSIIVAIGVANVIAQFLIL